METRCTPGDKLCVLYREPDADGVCPGPRCDFWSSEGCLLTPLGLALQVTREDAYPLLPGWRIVHGGHYAASSPR